MRVTRPLVAVIIPSRDRPELVSAAVRSVVRQSHDALEIVVVDDASTTPLALSDDVAGDPRVRLVRLEERSGAGAARNAGVRATRGELIAFLDDDDTWRPTKIERQLDVLAERDDLDAVETGYDLWEGERLLVRYVPEVGRDLRTTLLAKPCMQPSTVLLRRSAFEALGGFDPTLVRVEDWDLWVRFSESHHAAALPEVLVDRQESRPDPAQELRWTRELLRRIEPRIEALSPADRARTRSAHLLTEAKLRAEVGEGKASGRLALQAWREQPGDWRPPLAMIVRSAVGERAWAGGKAFFRATVYPVLHALGRDPFLRR